MKRFPTTTLVKFARMWVHLFYGFNMLWARRQLSERLSFLAMAKITPTNAERLIRAVCRTRYNQ